MSFRILVVSAVNFTEGGPLEVLRQFVRAASAELPSEWRIIVLAHRHGLVNETRTKVLAVPATKTSWSRRLIFEYLVCRRLAQRLRPDLWVALHDISPAVGATPQVVYCHNPAPFFRVTWRDAYMEPSLLLFRLFYAGLYRINLRRNRAIIVQQEWLRNAFRRWAGLRGRIVVAHPQTCPIDQKDQPLNKPFNGNFLYPALPRAFKNFEVIGQALQLLEAGSAWRSKVFLTVKGDENRYARWIHRKFGGLKSLVFMGQKSRAEMDDLYQRAGALLFASRLETWGLPMTEAIGFGLPVLAADLPYASETLGSYRKVLLFNPVRPVELAEHLLSVQDGSCRYPVRVRANPDAPFAADWASLIRLIADL